MRVTNSWKEKIIGQAFVAAAALAGILLFAGAPAAAAHGRDKCGRDIARAERKLDESVARHGFYSRQAQHWRHELDEVQDRCGYDSPRHGRHFRGYGRDRDGDRDRD